MTLLYANGQVGADQAEPHLRVLRLDPAQQEQSLDAVCRPEASQSWDRIELVFGKFTDGRPYSWAASLRDHAAFSGDLRAVGDVLVDQVTLMWRTGFTSFALRQDQSVEIAQRRLAQAQRSTRSFYQSSAAPADRPDIVRQRRLA
jgi:uncharacterized protein (DUF934 family)